MDDVLDPAAFSPLVSRAVCCRRASVQVAWPCCFGGVTTVGVLVRSLAPGSVAPRSCAEQRLLMSVSRLHSGTAGAQSGECRSCAGEDDGRVWCVLTGVMADSQASGRESWGWCFQLVGGVRTQGGPLPFTALQVGGSGSQPAGVWGCVPTHLAA